MDLSNIREILGQYRGGPAAPLPPNVEADYAKVAENAPSSHIASGLAEAFRSNDTPPFGQMLGSLFRNSDGPQRAGILNQLIHSVAPGLLSSGGVLGSLGGLFQGSNTRVTPDQANAVSPEAVQELAEHAEKQNPSIVDQASQFYAQHPTLVQGLGVGALAMIMSHMSRK